MELLTIPLAKIDFYNLKPLGSRSKNLAGSVFGNLTVLARSANDGQRNAMWSCFCACGVTKDIRGFSLTNGTVSTCGCKVGYVPHTKHGKSYDPVYKVWCAMWYRCTNPSNKSYDRYKDRAPPERWKSFENFIADMGERPTSAHTIERSDNTKPYGPDNCVWATRSVQNSNRSNTIFMTNAGVTKPLIEWAKECGIAYSTLLHRVQAKWATEEALGLVKRPYQRINGSSTK
jgi:hypothetical protein